MEDQRTDIEASDDDVEAHKKAKLMAGEDAPREPGEDADDDVEAHRKTFKAN